MKSSRLLHYVIDPSTMTVNAKCTMEKIIRQSFSQQSGSLSNVGAVIDQEQGIGSPEYCDDGTLAPKTCHKLNQTFFKHFRTIHGQCNNVINPLYGSKGSQLSRFLPAEHTKIEKPTFFEKPAADGKLNIFSVGNFYYSGIKV